MACTPLISRQAIPAIFCTALCATLILPSSVDRRSAVPGLSSLVRAAGLAVGAVLLVCVIRVHSFCRSVEGPGVGGPSVEDRSAEAALCRPRRVGTGTSVRSALLDTGRPETSHIFYPGRGRWAASLAARDGRIKPGIRHEEGRWDQRSTTLNWSGGPGKATSSRTPISSTVTGCWPTGWRCGCWG